MTPCPIVSLLTSAYYLVCRFFNQRSPLFTKINVESPFSSFTVSLILPSPSNPQAFRKYSFLLPVNFVDTLSYCFSFTRCLLSRFSFHVSLTSVHRCLRKLTRNLRSQALPLESNLSARVPLREYRDSVRVPFSVYPRGRGGKHASAGSVAKVNRNVEVFLTRQ